MADGLSNVEEIAPVHGGKDRGYWLEGLVEVDDAFVGGRKSGKRGRGAEGKKPVIFAVEQQEKGMGFMAAHLVERVNFEQVPEFAKRISPDAEVRTDAFLALRVLGESHRHEAKVPPLEKVDEWLPKVHIVISNFKSFLAGTFHGVSHRYLQEYIDEFVSASIGGSGNLNCQTGCCKLPLIMCQFRPALLIVRGM